MSEFKFEYYENQETLTAYFAEFIHELQKAEKAYLTTLNTELTYTERFEAICAVSEASSDFELRAKLLYKGLLIHGFEPTTVSEYCKYNGAEYRGETFNLSERSYVIQILRGYDPESGAKIEEKQ